MDFTPT